MPSHNVKFTLPERELGKVDAKFFVYEDGKKLGEITISRGAIEYYPANAQKPVKMSWAQFDLAMKEYKCLRLLLFCTSKHRSRRVRRNRSKRRITGAGYIKYLVISNLTINS